MPKRHNKTKRGGGIFEGWFGSTSSTGTGTGLFSFFGKPKPSQSYNTTSYNTTPSYPSGTQGAMYNQPYGGRRRVRRTRKLRGGFKDNISQTGLAAHAASFSGPTAQPQTWVGGKRHKKSRKTRRH